LTFNLGLRSASLSLGRRGAHLTVGSAGTRETVGLPGSGVSYTTAHCWRHRARRHGPNVLSGLLGLVLIWAIIRTLMGG
jgi:Protein of unknown function (DUF4236)